MNERQRSLQRSLVALQYAYMCHLYCLMISASLASDSRVGLGLGLVEEGQELLALDLLEGLGVGGVTGRTSGDTKWHDGGVLHGQHLFNRSKSAD